MATSYKFTWDKGATIIRVLRWLQDVAPEGSDPDYQPVNLTGYIGRMELRDKHGGTLLYRLDTTLGNMTIDGPEGTITLEIPATLTTTWTWRNAVYDIELVSATGRVTRLLQGTITLSPEVTTGD